MPTDALLEKYNQDIPRYTSYPTIPYWDEKVGQQKYFADFKANFELYNKGDGIAIYIHLPFCEKLCTYCGCNKIITTNHNVEEKYLQAVINEWYMYLRLMPSKPVIRELHFGGGTPTFFSPENLRILLNSIFEIADIHADRAFSVEGHPNNTTREHLELLYQFGFRRISYGVQDHDPNVQRLINRIQPYENVKRVTEEAREVGFTSVNYDLIYGLPGQTAKSMTRTVADTIALRPDRIAFYSYAHVPWKAKSQRLYDENDLPDPKQKLKFYTLARHLFLQAGYTDIGMDHFSLPTDELYSAFISGKLHRNFMGYTTAFTNFLVGLGVSAISDVGTAFAQNVKQLANYYREIENGEIPIEKGYLLDETDKAFKRYILDIACRGVTYLKEEHQDLINRFVRPKLEALEKDQLISLSDNKLQVTEPGRIFLRNICNSFDLKQTLSGNSNIRFSKSI